MQKGAAVRITELEKRIELVRERCFLTEAGRLFLELLLLAEWDPDLKKYEGIRADELFRMWKERKTEKNVPKDWKSAERELYLVAEPAGRDEMGKELCRVRKQILEFLEQEYETDPCNGFLEIVPDLNGAEEPDPERSVYRKMLRFERKKRTSVRDWLLLNVSGKDGSGRMENVRAFCREKEMGLILLDGMELCETERAKRGRIFREAGLNAILRKRVIALKWSGNPEETGLFRIIGDMEKEWEALPVLAVIITETPMRPVIPGSTQVPAVFEICEPGSFSRKEMGMRYAEKWKIPFEGGFGEMWQRFRFTPGQFRNVLEQAGDMAFARGGELPTREELRDACRRQAEYRFQGKASLIRPQFTWDDLVLSETSKQLLRDICSRSRNQEQVYGTWKFASRFPYGLGTSILFTGSPGTGKTMAAQVMAKELDLELFRVNLSAVVSKYVGETEKNLNLIFDEASRSLCILFFDEADALFGKRTEVKDSQDKYQNMEAAFLLQKMEEYDGISILATNYQQNMDEAFKRRLQYVVEFSMPDAEKRLEMWKRAFPPECPLGENVDLQFLAEQFELTGSNIKNIAVNSAFFAAADGTDVEMGHLLRALRNEFQKSGKRLTGAELGQYGIF